MIHIKSSPSVTHTESGSRAEVRPSLVNRDPLAVASEPRLPLVQPTGEGYTSPLVVNLLTAEALVARHEGRTRQFGTGTVVRAAVIVVGHVFLSLFCSLVSVYCSRLSAMGQAQTRSPFNALAPRQTDSAQ